MRDDGADEVSPVIENEEIATAVKRAHCRAPFLQAIFSDTLAVALNPREKP
jgi:hypothetical protein